ncbi:calcium-dependent phosphotriesterase [Trichodelitschia bisporula]|uniref:Calcium-dependent phosphotriesterase n=1 Tax=Trichodelitschia bisporula TaxID=703511 RepID=A0A6G1HL56_9PEZI|nr:calcium-dependent phosphotriesterase [Trichodelitschia bisporula]
MRSFAYEGGVWVPERNEVWFTSEINKPPAYVFTLDLETNTVRAPALSRELVNPAGGFYFDGTLYFTEWGNRTTGARPGIVAIDPVSGQVTTLVDKFEDRRLNGPDDIAVVRDGNRTLLYFTDPDFATFFRIQGPPEGPDATYRLDLDTGELIRVVSARQLDPPNGVCFSPDGRTAYVSQTPFAPRRNRVNGGVKAIFAFDVTENELRNMRPFGEKARKGVPDGLKCDDEGRVWAAEGEGIVVRNSGGEILGGFKADGLKKGITRKTDVANFALAGDELVVLALDQIVRVKLARVVMSPERFR